MSYPVNVPLTYTAVGSTVGYPSATFSYAWLFDDGATGNVASLPHTWTTNGSHVATVVATDVATGITATTGKTVSVATVPAGWTGNGAGAPNRFWFALVYGGGLYVAAEQNTGTSATGKFMYSSDGINWTSSDAPADVSVLSLAYGNGIFVAVGQSFGYSSPDAITWTARTVAARTWQGVAFGSGKFVAIALSGGATGQIMTSSDGITWAQSNTPIDRPWSAITYGGGKFIAVARVSSDTQQIITSTDGLTWSIANSPSNQDWYSVTFGNGIWMASNKIGGTGINALMVSTDAVTWTAKNLGFTNTVQSVAFGSGIFVAMAAGSSPAAYWSMDGNSWASMTTVVNGQWRQVIYGNGLFITADYGGLVTNKVQRLAWV